MNNGDLNTTNNNTGTNNVSPTSNGSTNTNINTNSNIADNNNTLQPMAGVKIAPPTSEPVNASNSQTATSALSQSVSGSSVTSSGVQTQPANQTMMQQGTINQQAIVQPAGVNTSVSDTNTITGEGISNNEQIDEPVKKKKRSSIVPLLLLIILALGGYLYFSANNHTEQIKNLMYNCTPITASDEAIKLDLNSTLVQDLYNKVLTNIKEDYASNELNDQMKVYLAYRQILESKKYNSNCNLFNDTSMSPYKCDSFNGFEPKAFKVETLQLEIKKLFGEQTNIPLQNVQLSNSCIGGYQYIPDRGEFVQGYCSSQGANFFSVDKSLVEATSTKNTIVLVEDVKYHENEKMSLPEYLKSGLYYYTFRLDLNYNYVLVSKKYESKY